MNPLLDSYDFPASPRRLRTGLFCMFNGYMYNRGYICDLVQHQYKHLIFNKLSLLKHIMINDILLKIVTMVKQKI